MFCTLTRQLSGLLLVILLLVSGVISQQVAKTNPLHLTTQQQLLRGIYQELIEINTTDSVGDTTKAAEAMAVRLRAAGFPRTYVRVLANPGNNRKGNLVARYRSANATRKPLLLLAHIDVVEARKEDWSDNLNPFKLTERDGIFTGAEPPTTKRWRRFSSPISFVTNRKTYSLTAI